MPSQVIVRVFALLAAACLVPVTGWAADEPAQPSSLEVMIKEKKFNLQPSRPITRGPRSHWFSYYDVQQFDPTGRYILAMAVDFERRQPKADDEVTIGMIDLKDGDRWTTLGTTTAWCWQQGCRLQWRPGSDREILWNDREKGRYVCRILDIKSGTRRTLPYPIDHISPDGKTALVSDFARTGHMRPAYGYQGIPDPHEREVAPSDSGVWKVDLDSGKRKMLFSLADIARIPSPGYTPGGPGRHYINHLGWAPDGKRFIFLNRGEKIDRMFTADAEGKNIRFITIAPSHFCWRDAETILCWSRKAYRLFPGDGSGGVDGEILYEAPNGHQTYLAGGEWLLTDTYPLGKERLQYLYLKNVKDGRIVIVGQFQSAERFSKNPNGGEAHWRCDLHPRLSPDQTKVTIDTVNDGVGHQLVLIDIGSVIGKH